METTQDLELQDSILARREARAAERRALAEKFRRPVIALTLVYPGPRKDTPSARFVFREAEANIRPALEAAGYKVLSDSEAFPATGPEGLLVVDARAEALKHLMVELEDSHPLGRLWDADVIDTDGVPVSRGSLGLAPRTCLICDEPGHACARSGRHPLADVQRMIALCIADYCGLAA